MYNTALNGYHHIQLTQVDLGELIILLYEGAIKFTKQAQEGFRSQDLVTAGIKLLRARNIVSELRNGLDFEQGGDLANNLEQLYTYMHDELLRAGRDEDPALLDPVLKVLTTLKEGWQESRQVAQNTIQKQSTNLALARNQTARSATNDKQLMTNSLSIKV